MLIKYGLVSFKPNKNHNIANYTLLYDKILLIVRYPAYISLIKQKFGEETEIMLEEIIQNGYACMSEVLYKTQDRLIKEQEKNVPFTELRDKFYSLIIAKYIERVPFDADEKPVPEPTISDCQRYIQPEINIKILSEQIAGTNTNPTYPDKNIYWNINHDRFHQDMRDAQIVSAIRNKFDPEAGEVIRILLQQMYIRNEPWTHASNPIPILEVKDIIRKMNKFPNLVAFFDNYVSVVEQDCCNVILKVGEASGGSYQINMKQIFTVLAWETIDQIVLERFGSKAARIFRLIKAKGYIEPDNIQKFAMIPAKEAKRISYQLLEENFVDIHELRKPMAVGAAKSFTLFHINLARVVRMVLDLCYKTMYNMLTRKFHEHEFNKRIIDKKQKVDTLLLTVKSQGAPNEQLADVII